MSRTFLLAAALAVLPLPGAAQEPGPLMNELNSRLLATRVELQEQLEELRALASSSAYSAVLRERADEEATLVARRLADGDFRSGDRIVLTVPGEGLVADTLLVVAGPALVFPEIGAIELAGVLRSELTDHLSRELATYIRDPDVRQADVLVGIEFVGAVANQGIHYVPAEAPMGDAMRVPGLTGDSDIENVDIRRGGVVIWDTESVREAVQEFRTLDQLSLQAGDEVRVPSSRSNSWLTWLTVTASVIASITIILRVF
jgi:protein involved in polysaccharide export with SLBB domain